MPQMAPLNWLSLMIMFITILIMFNMTNYYSSSNEPTLSKSKKDKNPINWKW